MSNLFSGKDFKNNLGDGGSEHLFLCWMKTKAKASPPWGLGEGAE